MYPIVRALLALLLLNSVAYAQVDTISTTSDESGVTKMNDNFNVLDRRLRTAQSTLDAIFPITLSSSAQVTGILPVANGGTGAATSANALNNLLTDQAAHTGEFLSTDGSIYRWMPVDQFVQTYTSDSTKTMLLGFADTERTTNSASYTKLKEIVSNGDGTVYITFDLHSSAGANNALGRIYKNGVAVGTERSTNSSTYDTYEESISVAYGDLIQLYVRTNNASFASYCRNFRIYAYLMDVNTD